MRNVILRKSACGTGPSCPTIEQVEGGVDLIGYLREDPSLPPGEAQIHWPDTAQMLPELTSLKIPDLGAYLHDVRQAPGDLLRVQTLARYGVPSDDEDYMRYVNGAPAPLSPFRDPWYRQLRDERAAGQIWRNVHVVDLPLGDYLRYQFEWCYAYNVEAGQDVRILDTVGRPEAEAIFAAGDFYVIDRKEIIHMRYDADGSYLGAVGTGASSTAGYRALGELAWRLATPFTQWWAAHPEYQLSPPDTGERGS